MEQTFARQVIAKRVMVSAFIAVVFGGFFVLPLLTAPQLIATLSWLSIGGPFFTLVGAVLVIPLVATALLTAIVFRKSIEKHLRLWCGIAPVTIWAFVCFALALLQTDQLYHPKSLATRLSDTFSDVGNLLFLISPAVAALAFYVLSERRRRRV